MRVELQVVSGRGAPHALALVATTELDARTQAEGLGYTVLAARPPLPSLRRTVASNRRTSIDFLVFVEQLRDLLQAGLSVVEALATLSRGLTGEGAAAIEALERRLREGKSLSEALEAGPDTPPLLVALVRASELTSDLPQTLTRFLDHERRVAEVRHRIVSAAIYPVLLISVGSLVLLFLMFYVMPRFSRVFEGMNGPLPWSARMMVAWGEFLRSNGTWWLVAALFVLLGIGSVLAPATRAALWRRLMRWQPLRSRLRTYSLARWYRATGMLVEGGIPLASSLGLANGVLPPGLREGGEAVEQGVRQGLSPAQAHARAGMATPVAEQLLLAGERTGDLGAVLSRIALFHEAEVSRSLERTMRALEPIVMVLIGLGVGIVVVLMYLPIFELASAIQ